MGEQAQGSGAHGRAYSSQLAERDDGSEGMSIYCSVGEGWLSFSFLSISSSLLSSGLDVFCAGHRLAGRRQVPERND